MSSLDVDDTGGVVPEHAEQAIEPEIDRRRLDGPVVERIDRDAAGGERLPDGAVGQDHEVDPSDARAPTRRPPAHWSTSESRAGDAEQQPSQGLCVTYPSRRRISDTQTERGGVPIGMDWAFGERVTGIEPAFSAWEADVLPLNYTRESERER